MKWSLKAGMSFSVAMQPSADMRQLITRGRTGTGDMLPGILVGLCPTDQISFLANLTLPLQTIDERALAVFTEVNTCHIGISEPNASPRFRCQRRRGPRVTMVIHIIFHYGLLAVDYLSVLTPRLVSLQPLNPGCYEKEVLPVFLFKIKCCSNACYWLETRVVVKGNVCERK